MIGIGLGPNFQNGLSEQSTGTVAIVDPSPVYDGVETTVSVTATGDVVRVVLDIVGGAELWDDNITPFEGSWRPDGITTVTLRARGYDIGDSLIATNTLEVTPATRMAAFAAVGISGSVDCVWDPEIGVVLDGEGKVQTWADLGGTRILVFPAGRRPVWLATGYLGRACLVFAGNEYGYLQDADILAAYSGLSKNVVLACACTASAAAASVAGGLFGASGHKHGIYATAGGASLAMVRNNTYPVAAILMPTGSAGGAATYAIEYKSTVGKAYTQGIQRQTGTMNNTQTFSHFAVGSRLVAGVPDQLWTGRLGLFVLAQAVTDWPGFGRVLCGLGVEPLLDKQPVVGWLWGDSQDGGAKHETMGALMRAHATWSGSYPDLIASVGDLGSNPLSVPNYTRIIKVLEGFADASWTSETLALFFAALGNHDYEATKAYEAVRDAAFTGQAAVRNGHQYFSKTVTTAGGKTILCIALDGVSDEAKDATQLAWFTAQLAGATEDAIVVAQHERTFSADTWDNGHSVASDLPWFRLMEAKVAAGTPCVVLGGHVHVNECATVNGVLYLTLGSLAAPNICDPDPNNSETLIYGGDSFDWDAAVMCDFSEENVFAGCWRVRETSTQLVFEAIDMVGSAATGYLPVMKHSETISI